MEIRNFNIEINLSENQVTLYTYQGRIHGGGGGGGTGCAPPKIGKNMIFWRKIVIFHTKYPKHFRPFLCSAQLF